MNDYLTIVGASARAAAHSARRAGYTVHAADLFADVDLGTRCASSARVHRYAEFAPVIDGEQPGAWMYTGALENHPALVERLARKRRLLGNAAAVLRRVRSPVAVAHSLARAALPHMEVRRTSDGLPLDGTWLRKSLRSAGGADIEHWDGRASTAGRSDRGYYFQRYSEGAPCSAVFVAAGDEARLIGVTRQLIGAAWTGARGYQFCGSIGPMKISVQARDQLAALGSHLAREFQLQGLVGVDAVFDGDNVWPIEINPRYPASAEVLEQALGINVISLHVAACLDARLPPIGLLTTPSPIAEIRGKAILFASRRLLAPSCVRDFARQQWERPWPELADLPAVGTVIDPASPVLTVFAGGESETEVLDRLKAKLADTRTQLESGAA
ncbi:MAG TPA: ATP-grasp domain-containing protein [Pirellulales bacterium]|nr:ATP-grasp domain-containing protein [Pirellulales bacterium]